MTASNHENWRLGSAAHAAQRAAALTALLVVEQHDEGDLLARARELLLAFGEPSADLEMRDVWALREAARTVYAVFAASDMVSAVQKINGLLAQYATAPRLTAHDGTAWHLHVDARDDAPWAEWFIASSAMALAILTSDKQRPPGGLCASPPCGRPFIDLGKGGGRRYCSPRCATRERVAAHRRKQD